MLADQLNLPVALEHDAKVAALGEYYYGAGRGQPSMVYIVAGTGVGAAIIIDGQLYRGMHNFAGEVGGVTIDRNGEIGAAGIKGCVQGYLRGPALARRYQQLKNNDHSVTGEEVAQLAEQGDEAALQVMTLAGEALGITVASLAMILDIELYVIGGSVIKAGDLLFAPAQQILPQYCFESIASHVKIVPVDLGDDGPLLGCAWLARQAVNQK
jgi:glucokinase